MYLKKIELFGFKTFADATSIEFHPNNKITAIVGPNGCGKSNVFDAVRWILGEQSLALIRSSSSEEIIFSGTDKRKPISLASAAITIDNTDGYLPLEYSEVTIKRKVYRSGESEYFINKEPCRLKDIINLFLDTGLGRDSYFMVGQGQIESILSSKPDERRAIFEEAAGINKYKTRKKAAEKKLKNVEQNLMRLNDLRVELKNRLEPLAIQAQKAEEYIDLKNKLKEIEIGFYKEKVDRLLKQKQKIKEDIEGWLKELNYNEKQKQEISQNKVEIEEERKSIDTYLDQMKEELNNIRIHRENISGERKLAELNLKNCQEKQVSIDSDISKIKQDEEEINTQKQSLLEKLNYIISEEEAEKGRLTLLEKEELLILNHWKEIVDKLESLKEGLFILETDLVRARNEFTGAEHQKSICSRELDKANNELAKLYDKKEEQIKLTNQLIETKEYLIVNKNETDTKLVSHEEALKELEEKLNDIEIKKINIKETFDKQSSKLMLLKEMIKGFEGYDDGVKSILVDKREGHVDFADGILGVVADMFETEKNYETAIEVSLGNRIQSIITSNSEVSHQALNYLKSKNLGRASFLCKEALRSVNRTNSFMYLRDNYPGFIGVAPDLIRTEHINVFEYLLGETIIVDNISTALAIGGIEDVKKEINNIITLEGDVLELDGELIGGSSPKTQSILLNRQKQIMDIEEETQKLKNKNNDIEINIHIIKGQKQEALKAYEAYKENNRGYGVELKALEDEFARRKEALNDLENEIDIALENKSNQNNEIIILDSKKEAILSRQSDLEKEKLLRSEEVDFLETKRAELDVSREELQKKVMGQKIVFAQKSAEKKQWQNHIDILTDNSNKQLSVLRDKEREKDYLYSFEREMKAKLKEIEELIPKITDDEKKKEEELKEKVIFKSVAQEKTRELEKEQENLLLSHDDVKEKLTQEEIKLARIDADLESIENILQEEHQATIEDVLKVETKIEDIKEAYRQASQYKKRIRELEPVNVLAVDEYKITNERFVFVDKQCLDLAQAKENLEKLIRQLDSLAKTSFVETIKSIRKHFSQIFEKLFDGGRADLIISDESNILESSIEIFAQPPGKKLSNLNLLSGGEKALTGVSLIFALMKIKPSPFCFLDEVDASLDESNIERFVELLNEFTINTQMIVITHNKRTMHSANSLYGVTMEEMGISKLISMKLVDGKKLVREGS